MLETVTETIRRATLPLPFPPSHVHVYLLRGSEGWTAVDTGLGLTEAEELWTAILHALEAPVVRLAITHFHPDHVGAAADAVRVTGAEVFQGELDYAQCEQVWGSADWPERIASWMERHGTPSAVAQDVVRTGEVARPLIRYAQDPQRLNEGDTLDCWRVLGLPGHSDGHIGFERDGILVAGDHLLPDISPAVGRYADGRPDPLGAYLDSLRRTVKLAPKLALPGHGEPIRDPAGRARALIEHHRERLDATMAALRDGPQTAYDVSLALFTGDLDASGRRFAVAESLAHLERLEVEGRVSSARHDAVVRWAPRG